MTRTRSLLMASCALLVFVTGCVVTSIYPFYTAKDISFDAAMTGTWTNIAQADEVWNFTTTNSRNFNLVYVSGKSTNNMQATFFKLRDNTFLDLINFETGEEIQPPPIPAHYLLRVAHGGNSSSRSVTLTTLDYDWLFSLLTNNPSALRHHLIGNLDDPPDQKRLVLTADTPELQRFVMKHLKDTNAWKSTLELKKKTD